MKVLLKAGNFLRLHLFNFRRPVDGLVVDVDVDAVVLVIVVVEEFVVVVDAQRFNLFFGQVQGSLSSK